MAQRPREAKAREVSLSLNLMGAAAALLVAGIYAASTIIDKVEPTALTIGYIIGVGAAACLIGSMIAGGKGITTRVRPGPRNAFNVQVWLGLIGIIGLAASAGVFLFNRAQPNIEVESRLRTLEQEQQRTREFLRLQARQIDERVRRLERTPPPVAPSPSNLRSPASRDGQREK